MSLLHRLNDWNFLQNVIYTFQYFRNSKFSKISVISSILQKVGKFVFENNPMQNHCCRLKNKYFMNDNKNLGTKLDINLVSFGARGCTFTRNAFTKQKCKLKNFRQLRRVFKFGRLLAAPPGCDQFENRTDYLTFALGSIFELAMKIMVLFLSNGIYRRLQTILIVTNRSFFVRRSLASMMLIGVVWVVVSNKHWKIISSWGKFLLFRILLIRFFS